MKQTTQNPIPLLTDGQIKELLLAAKATSEKDWEVLSYFVATGKRSTEVVEDLKYMKISRRKILAMFHKYSKLLPVKITPHMIRHYDAIRLQQLGVHPNIIAKKLRWNLQPSFF